MVTQANLKDALAQHISNTGFPLEIETTSILEKNQWDVISNYHFIDPVEQKSREVDIVCGYQNDEESDITRTGLVYNMMIECKRSAEDALVTFPGPGFHHFDFQGQFADSNWRLRNKPGSKFKQFSHGLDNFLGQNLHFVKLDKISNNYLLTKPKGKSKPDIYEAIAVLTKAQEQSYDESLEDSDPSDYHLAFFTFLTIVFDGLMFEASVLDGRVELFETDHGLIRSKQFVIKTRAQRSYLIDVVTKKFFPDYLRLLKEDFQRVSRNASADSSMREYFGLIRQALSDSVRRHQTESPR